MMAATNAHARDVTVIIPTTNRPEFLRTALRSVASQTAIGRVREVIVSENAGAEATAATTQEFSRTLPIRFVLRTPPLAPLDHFEALFAELPADGFVALLHDDDWWHDDHLARALHAIATGGSVAHFGAHYFVCGESSPVVANWTFRMWFGAEYPKIAPHWFLNAGTMIFAALTGTPAHYSGMVASAAALTVAARATNRHRNPYDNDRIFIVELSQIGVISFSPLPSIFVRLHANQEGKARFTNDRSRQHVEATTRYVLETARRLGVDVKSGLVWRLQRCPTSQLPVLVDCFRPAEIRGPMGIYDALPDPLAVKLQDPAPTWRSRLRDLIPPIVLDAKRNLASRI